MNYINCPSFSSIFFALYLKNKNRNITVVTINESVKKYCEFANIKYLFLKKINFGLKNPWRIVSFKKQIDNMISKIGVEENDNFYLLDNSFTLEGFYIAKEWSKKGKVYFKDLEKIKFKEYSNKHNIKKITTFIFIKYLMKLYLNIEIKIMFINDNPVFIISRKYLENDNIFNLNINKDLSELKLEAIKNNSLKLKQYDNLIAAQGKGTGILKNNSIFNLYHKLLNYDFDYVIKEHPTVKNPEMFDKCHKYPDYIPAELIMCNINNNVISISSSTLILASQLDRIQSISLIDLVEWKNEEYKIYIKEFLSKESNGKIIFVKSFDELIQYL